MSKTTQPPAGLRKPLTIAPPSYYAKMAKLAAAKRKKRVINQREAGDNTKGAAMRGPAILDEEWSKARKLILEKLPVAPNSELGPWFVTVGDPKLRLLPRDIDQFSPDAVQRRWRSGITQLRKINPNLIGVCVVELGLCKLLERPADGGPHYFFEPHFHAIIDGVTEAQTKAAFKVRRDPATVVRKRAVKVEPVTDLPRLIGYITKARPMFLNQYLSEDGTLKWGDSKIPLRHKAKWLRVMAPYQVTDLLSSTGISLRILG